VFGFFIAAYGSAAAGPLALRDSVGVKTVNGKTFISHKVEPKETLYAISRKYGVTVAQIVEANKNIENSIQIGQVVLVPLKARSNTAATAKATVPAPANQTVAVPPPATSPAAGRTYTIDGNGNKRHTVQPSQTLYSISKMHSVTVEQIKKWNNLADNSIEIGTDLIVGVGAKGSSPATASSQIYVPERDDQVAAVKQSTAPVASAPASPAATETSAAAPETNEEKPAKSGEYMSRVSESGMAELIEQKSDANKFLALHKTAPVGTIMAVRNPSNDQTVYVRVIGKLPSTGDNDKLVVKLSKKACQQIGVNDKRFRVELSYMP